MNELHLQRLASEEWRATLKDHLLPFTLGDLGLRDLGDDVLEIGPGPGLTTDLLRDSIPRLTAIEVDPELARALEDRLSGSGVVVVNDDATAMPFPDASFTGVVFFTMLHHVPTPQSQDALFAEVGRVLRPGGVLIASDGVASEEFEKMHDGDIYVPVDPAGLADRLEAAGFDDVNVRANSLVWAVHARRRNRLVV